MLDSFRNERTYVDVCTGSECLIQVLCLEEDQLMQEGCKLQQKNSSFS